MTLAVMWSGVVKGRMLGVTLLELLWVVALLGILVGIAVPSFSGALQGRRQAALINDFTASLALARSEAIKRGRIVSMCRSADLKKCGGSGDWASGWLVFVDSDPHGKIGRYDPGEPLLVQQAAVYPGVRMTGNHNIKTSLSFRGTGILRSDPGTFVACDERGAEHANALIMAWSGRLRPAPDLDHDGIVNLPLPNGKNVSCD
jgi:type IV fimbrial biogenesis protein FimT